MSPARPLPRFVTSTVAAREADLDWARANGEVEMRFEATLLEGGKNATGIEVPGEVVEGLGAGKRPKVSVTINGFT